MPALESYYKPLEEGMNIAKYIDHTALAANATKEKIEALCKEAYQYGFKSVCVNSCWVKLAAKLLSNTEVEVCTVVGFPLGAMDSLSKADETRNAVVNGADEIDMVINVGFLKSGMYEEVLDDIRSVRSACIGKTLKVIIETCLLTDEEKRKACELAMEAKADFVKTSTGFSTGGATVEDVALMRSVVGDKLGVKASGGIRDYKSAKAMIDAGATRIGASSGIRIVEEQNADN